MKKKLSLSAVIIIVVSAFLGYVFYPQVASFFTSSPSSIHELLQDAVLAKVKMNDDIRRVLTASLEDIENLAVNEHIIEHVKQSNALHHSLSLEDKLHLDRHWRTAPDDDDVIMEKLTNKVAKQLYVLQEQNPGYAEIFVADAHGLNVGQTNRTTDYYQADEDWWVETFNSGYGKAFHGDFEFDESSFTDSVPLYVPIYDTNTNTAIGVIKTVVDLLEIKNRLNIHGT